MVDETQLTKKERKLLKKQQKQAEQIKTEQSKKIQKWAVYAGILSAIAFAGWFYWSRQVSIPPQESNKPVDQVLSTDWVKGDANAPVILVEYSDFQCPACAAYQDLLAQIKNQFGENLAIVYRHYPLRQIHLQADIAAQAAEAAGKQGKFWEMHDLLFTNQQTWAEDRKAKKIFDQFAMDLGLNLDQFKVDMNAKETKGLVQADYVSGIKQQINATPTFFLNGTQIDNPTSVEAFAQLIQSKLPATGSAQPTSQ